MHLPKLLVLITALLPMAISTADVRNLRKRSAISYAVEGCFSSFPAPSMTKQMEGHNSNVKCQDTCRDKGYLLAATQGDQCQCGNVYPKGHKVNDTLCTTRCRSWSPCQGPQSCCGGPGAYSMSLVGNIDVAKQVLRRLSHEWQTNTEYRNYMREFVPKPDTQSHIADWSESFKSKGWSICGHGRYMTGMYRGGRTGSDPISLIEQVKCVDAPGYLYPEEEDMDCYTENWWTDFDQMGWVTCGNGYYMTELYRTPWQENLHNIEWAQCCRPKSQEKSWGDWYDLDVSSSFDQEGWSECAPGYYMAGLYRSSCDKLNCLENFKCCKMGAYNGDSWVERPNLVIKVKDTTGQLKHCSMNAMDKSASSSTFQCKDISNRTNVLKLNALKFNIEDKSALNVAKPLPVEGFLPVTCLASEYSYTCAKTLTTEISTSSSFTIGTGISLAATVGASVEVSEEFLGVGAKEIFSADITTTSSFSTEASKTHTYKTSEATDISIDLPKNTEIIINLLRKKQDLEYKWKAVFELLGKYSAKWKNDQEIFEDVTTVLSGSKREMYVSGSYSYPATDILEVVVTDKYGNKKSSGCEHAPGKATPCHMKV